MKDETSDAPSWVPPEGLSLSDLIARVEAATGPDRELDGLMEVAARWAQASSVGLKPEHRARWECDAQGWVRSQGTIYPAATFTASLDAALALVERVLPGWFVGLQQNRFVGDERRWTAYITLNDGEHEATTYAPALALLAALLRALQAKASAEGTFDGSSLKSSESLPNDQ